MKELLSPAGNMDSLKAAIKAGANSVYIGGKLFGARAYANNFDEDELKKAVIYSHLYGVKVYVTVNIVIFNYEVDYFLEYIKYLYEIGVDALIMQDIGMISLVREMFPNIEIDASTQMHIHNDEGIFLVESLGIKKVVLDRELSLKDINNLTCNLEKEVFIHGALCNCYSGCCLFSSMNGSRSGNRGECVQSCRMPYLLLEDSKKVLDEYKYLLSTKELNTSLKFSDLMKSNVSTFKIEGRMKSPSYVFYVTKLYRKLIDSFYRNERLSLTSEELDNIKILFNRGFTSGYLFDNKSILNIDSENHQGLIIGEVIDVNKYKIKIKLSKDLYQDDGIRFLNLQKGMIANKIYNSNNLLVNKALKGDIIYLDNKLSLAKKDTIVKTSSIYLDKMVEKYPDKKILLNIKVINDLIIFTDEDNNSESIKINITKAINRATTKDEIKDKLTKLGNTIFKVNNISINIDNGIFINMKDLNNARRFLIDSLISKRTILKREIIINDKKKITKTFNKGKIEISAYASNCEQVKALLDTNVDRIYVDSYLYYKYKDNPKFYLRIPRVNKKYDENIKNVLVTELGGIYKYHNCNMIGDYFLNVTNNYSINYLLSNNVKRVNLSPEIDLTKIDDFILDKAEILIYGKVELMITKSSIMNEFSKDYKDACKYELVNKKNDKYRVINRDNLTHIMHYKNTNYLDKIDYFKSLSVKSLRLDFLDESYSEVVSLINSVKAKLNL